MTHSDNYDEVQADIDGELSYHRSRCRVPLPRDGKIARFFKGVDTPDETTCDTFYIDRTTGREVLRYDAADPANTNPFYGAPTDADMLARKGCSIDEMIHPSEAVITDIELNRLCRTCPYGDYADYGDSNCE